MAPLTGQMILDSNMGTVISYDTTFGEKVLSNFNKFTKNEATPETNLESAQVKSYLQLLCDKVLNMISDAQVYQKTLRFEDA